MTVNLKYDTDPDALAWARDRVQRLIDKMRKFERQATEQGTTDPAQWRKIANILQSELVGGRGCVIAAFDERMVRLAPILADAIAPTVPPEPRAWRDCQGDVWTLGDDGLMHTRETAPFPREHVEKKWGPLVPVERSE